MPTIKTRKIFELGNSRVVVLLKDWLEWIKQKYGVELREVTVETNGCLVIKPKID